MFKENVKTNGAFWLQEHLGGNRNDALIMTTRISIQKNKTHTYRDTKENNVFSFITHAILISIPPQPTNVILPLKN